VAGLLLLAAGVLLMGAALAGFWRHVHGLRRLWLLPAVLVALVGLYVVAVPVALTVVPPTSHDDTPDRHGLTADTVRFPTADGARLSAWWVPSENGAAVVLLHGAGETRSATLPQAAVLAAHGYGVLMVDARGHGDSGGRGTDLGWHGDADVRAALEFLDGRVGVDPDRIAVLGLSMGGEEAIGAAAADPRIRAVVAEGATGRTAADKATWLPGGVSGALQRELDRLSYAVVDLLTPGPPPTALRDAVAAATGTPFLLITAGTMPDEQDAARVLRDAAPDRVQVWTVPGATHTHALAARPEEWEQRVLGFLDGALG
jgi:pimeloyl-ACP methyl ester carboxylesterase